MKFRPCIDLRNGRVVQIVGGSLNDLEERSSAPITNFESEKSPAEFARMYREDNLYGGHVIALGPGNEEAAKEALAAFPGGLQFGGGITPDNAVSYLDSGASHVIVTSYVFCNGQIDFDRLAELTARVGKERLVLDLSCRRMEGEFRIVTDRWQKFTDVKVSASTVAMLAEHCDEFLVHGVDVEGLRAGIDEELVELLGDCTPIPTTYAGGATSLEDLDRVERLGKGKVDLTIGSALDIFGGETPYRDAVMWGK